MSSPLPRAATPIFVRRNRRRIICRYLPLIAAAVILGIGPICDLRGEDPPAATPPATKSANDPTKPVPGGVRWFGRNHASNLEATKSKKIDLCLLGDSITAGWPKDQFGKYFGKYNAVNFGVGGDRTENVLWRLENGELKGTSPKVIVLLIGTNNAGFNTADEIALGVSTVVKKLRTDFADTKILLVGIFPKRDAANAKKLPEANKIIAKLDDGKMIRYLDVGTKFLNADGEIQDGMLADAVHLTGKGYEIWGDTMQPLLTEMMGQ